MNDSNQLIADWTNDQWEACEEIDRQEANRRDCTAIDSDAMVDTWFSSKTLSRFSEMGAVE